MSILNNKINLIFVSLFFLVNWIHAQNCNESIKLNLTAQNQSNDFDILFIVDTSDSIKNRLGTDYKKQMSNIVSNLIDQNFIFRMSVIPASQHATAHSKTFYHGKNTSKFKTLLAFRNSLQRTFKETDNKEIPAKAMIDFVNSQTELFNTSNTSNGEISQTPLIVIVITDEKDSSFNLT